MAVPVAATIDLPAIVERWQPLRVASGAASAGLEGEMLLRAFGITQLRISSLAENIVQDGPTEEGESFGHLRMPPKRVSVMSVRYVDRGKGRPRPYPIED